MNLQNSLIAIIALFLTGCGHFTPSPKLPPIPTASSTETPEANRERWSCTRLDPLPPVDDIKLYSSHRLFLLYKNAWLGWEDCSKTLALNHAKTLADDKALSDAQKKKKSP